MVPNRQMPAASVLLLILGLAATALGNPDKISDSSYPGIPRLKYTKAEVRIPMRDGVKLFTSLYMPRDTSRAYPILLQRTPYRVAPYGADRYPRQLGPSAGFDQAGYIFVFQDVRGRFMSEGTFVDMRPVQPSRKGPSLIDEVSDAHDTIAWLLKNVPGHNGRVGLRGISYPAFYALVAAIDGPPALKAISPQAPVADWFFDDVHRRGAFNLALTFDFLTTFGQPRPGLTTDWPEPFDYGTPDGYEFFLRLGPLGQVNARHFKGQIAFWNDIVAHPNYDAFWQSRNVLPRLKNIRAAALVVGGWYDNEDLYGTLKVHEAIKRQNPKNACTLVMGPWTHGGWNRSEGSQAGDTRFGLPASEQFQTEVELPFFEQHLRGGPDPRLPAALIFETGANRWRRLPAWPPVGTEARRLYLRPEGALAFAPPVEKVNASDDFISDPGKPVPYTQTVSIHWSRGFYGEDQRFASRRPDVLVYESEVLSDDLTVAGPLQATLYVSTDQTDADWVVKLLDVQPGRLPGDGIKSISDSGGQQLLVRAEAMRGRFRDSLEKPSPFVPGQVTRIVLPILDVMHTFKRGHRIVVQIQSSWFPFIDRNPQRYVPNIFEAKPQDFLKARHQVFRTASNPSHLLLGILPPPL